jgi:hypothetical protein
MVEGRGGALLTSCHILNRVPIKNKEKTLYKEWIWRESSLSYLRTWSCLAKVNVPINKKRKWIVSFWDMLAIALLIDFW